MTRSVWVVAACFLLFSPLWSQPGGEYERPGKKFNTWVELKNNLGLYNGQLYGFDDNYLALKDKKSVDLQLFSYEDIERVKVRRKGRIGRGMLIGAAVGTGIGFLLGEALVNEPEPDENPLNSIFESMGYGMKKLAYPTAGFYAGMAAGGIIGARVRQYPIYGQQESFEAFKAEIKE